MLLTAVALAGCGGSGGEDLVVYSGRDQELVAPLLERYVEETGTDLRVRYGGGSELAATIIEEGSRSPADVFFSQDAGALGALEKRGLLERLPGEELDRVGRRYRSAKGAWVGTSARARVVAYNRERVRRSELPRSIFGFADSRWKGRLGWAPTNASFQAFVTAMRKTEGEDATRRWLEDVRENDVQAYENNTAIRDAIARGEIDAGFINHYYVTQARAEEGADYPVELHFPQGGDPGSLVNVAGAAMVKGADEETAADFIGFLLERESQEYFARETKEYPLAGGAKADPSLRPLETIEQPDVDLSDLDDLQGTLDRLEETGAL